MTTLQELYRERRELRADMKEAGIKRMCTLNYMDTQTFRCNRRLQELEIAIRKAKLSQ